MFDTRNDSTELLIDLLQGALEEEGHCTKRFSKSHRYLTTAYDAIEIKGNDGNYYIITIDRRKQFENPRDGKMHLPSETYESI